MSSDLLDIRAAAALTGRHPETVRRWVWTGRLTARREGNRLLVARSELEALTAGARARDTSLAAWRDRVVDARRSRGGGADGQSAADLVLEDRRRRASAVRAGR